MVGAEDIRTGFAEVNGARLYYEMAGQGDTLVLLHAGVCDCRMWDEQWSRWAQNYRVVRYDWRGCGRSSHPANTFSHRDDLYDLLRFLGVEQAILVAASYGGRIALEFTLEHPEMVKALALVGSGPGGVEPSDDLLQGWEEVEAAVTAGNIARANEIELRLWVDGPWRRPEEVDPRVRERVREMNANNLLLATAEVEEEPLEPPVRVRLGEVDVPTLVVVGDLDQPFTVEGAGVLAAEISGARWAAVPGTAHLPSMEQPERFSEIVLSFVRSL